MTGGRVQAAIGTGNSAARGISLPPATLGQIEEAVACMRAWWAGESARYESSQIPATGILRHGCSLLVAADGLTGAKLASKIGYGFVFGGGLDGRLVRDPISMGIRNSEQKAWVAPAVSLATTRDEVIAESFALTARAS